MSESNFKVNPPNLGNVETLVPFLPGGDLSSSDYTGFAFSDIKWPEDSYPAVRFDTVLFQGAVLSRTKMRSAALEEVRLAACDLSSADWTARGFPGLNSYRQG